MPDETPSILLIEHPIDDLVGGLVLLLHGNLLGDLLVGGLEDDEVTDEIEDSFRQQQVLH